MRYILVLLGLMVANVANAIDCQEVPSCEELGYTKNEEAGCLTDGYISCPFDTSYRKCVQHDCEKLGFTKSDKSSWCASIITCKSDSSMTLCQKPCLATTYDELKDLAESGKCKLITIKNDITLPQNQGITLHADTIIDGGNHTITSSGNQENLKIFSMNNNTGMKNIKLHHTQTETQKDFSLVKASDTNHVSLENMNIVTSSDVKVDHWGPVLRDGIYDIRGKFAIDADGKVHFGGFYSLTANFSDAQVSINIKGTSADMFVSTNLTFTNSSLDADIEGVGFTHKGSATFINSQANLNAYGLFYGSSNGGEEQKIVLNESSLTTSVKNYINANFAATITLKGTGQNPSVLNLTFKEASTGGGQTHIITTDTTEDTLILNGTTYHPTKAATTELTAVATSDNWTK